MTVIKRSGLREPFQPEKISLSLAAASDELKQPLNSGDLKWLVGDLEQRLAGREEATSRLVLETLVEVLRKAGFSQLAKSYWEHSQYA